MGRWLAALAHPASRSSGLDDPMQLWAYAHVDNIASVRVMTKAGLRFAELREHNGRPYTFFTLGGSPTKR